MLPPANRLRRSADFSAAVRSGVRARSGRLVVHQQLPDHAGATAVTAADPLGAAPAPRVGLVVGRSVGSSVVRHRVSRQLRAVLRDRLDRLPAGSATVVRALPPAAGSASGDLARDVDHALDRLRRPRTGRR